MKRFGWVKWVVGSITVVAISLAAFWSEAPQAPLEADESQPTLSTWREVTLGSGEQVTELLLLSTAARGESVNYKTVYKEDVYFPLAEACLPWDEVLFLVRQVGLVALPAIRKLEVQSRRLLVQNDVLYLRMEGRVPLDNKLLRLLLGGKDHLELSVYLKIRVTEEGVLWAEDMQLASPSITSDSTWRFACRYLTGEGDYLTLARTYLGATRHVGKVGKEGRLGPVGLSDEGVNLILNQNY